MNEDGFYRKRAMRRLAVIAVILVAAGVAVWLGARSGAFQRIAALENSAQNLAAQEAGNNFSAPEPLIATSTGSSSSPKAAIDEYKLSRAGIITDTNMQRAAYGNVPALTENKTLDDIAQIRLDDMFAKQYFAHISPASSSAITVAKSIGYAYIALGENLALGNFVGDPSVVMAWMNSPGHRANILNAHYTQIGVAAEKGEFQGQSVWIAVQIFGRPLSDCPPPDGSLQAQINNEQSEITAMESQIEAEKAAIDAMQAQGDGYNQAVNDYNTHVETYDALVSQAKSDVAQYNMEVKAYNTCIGPTTSLNE